MEPSWLTEYTDRELYDIQHNAESTNSYVDKEKEKRPEISNTEALRRISDTESQQELNERVSSLKKEALEAGRQLRAEIKLETLPLSSQLIEKETEEKEEEQSKESKRSRPVSIQSRFELWRAGVRGETARKVVDFIEHLQEHYFQTTYKYFSTNISNANQLVQKKERQGWTLLGNMPPEDTAPDKRVSLSFSKEIEFDFDPSHLDWIKAFVENTDDPKKTFDQIASVLFPGGVFYARNFLKELVTNSEALRGVEILAQAGIKLMFPESDIFIADLEKISAYSDELSSDSEATEILRRCGQISSGKAIGFIEVLTNKDTMLIISQLNLNAEPFKLKMILEKVLQIERNGLVSSVISALNSVSYREQVLNLFNGYLSIEEISKVLNEKPLAEMEENQEFQEYFLAVNGLFPSSYTPDQILDFYNSPVRDKILAVLAVWSEIEPEDPLTPDLLTVIPSSDQNMRYITDPDFPRFYGLIEDIFAVAIAGYGKNFSKILWLTANNEMRMLLDSFNQEDLRTLNIGHEILEYDWSRVTFLSSLILDPNYEECLDIVKVYFPESQEAMDLVRFLEITIKNNGYSYVENLLQPEIIDYWRKASQHFSDNPMAAINFFRTSFIETVNTNREQVDTLCRPVILAYLREVSFNRESTEAAIQTDQEVLDVANRFYDIYGFVPNVIYDPIRSNPNYRASLELLMDPETQSVILNPDPENIPLMIRILPYMEDQFSVSGVYKLLNLSPKILDLCREQNIVEIIAPNVYEFINLDHDKQNKYADFLIRLQKSPSKEIKRIMPEIFRQVITSRDPEKTFETIEQIFVQNNLPLVGKVYKIFCELNDTDHFLHQADVHSPVITRLQKIGQGGRESRQERAHLLFRTIVYRDLLKVHILSGNRNLRSYLCVLSAGQDIFDRIESVGFGELTPPEKEDARSALKRVNTIFLTSHLGKIHESLSDSETASDSDLETVYNDLLHSLEVKKGQSISQRLGELFLSPLGYHNFDEAINAMDRAISERDRKSRTLVQQSGGILSLREGDLIKGVNHAYITNILQNGSVAIDFLGASAGRDTTPFDTDASIVTAEDEAEGFEGALQSSLANSYGSLKLVFSDEGQFSKTPGSEYEMDKYELFSMGPSRHRGIRTGIASSEIKFMISDGTIYIDHIGFEIAKNGFYIPIVDNSGKVIFTPEMYDRMRQFFAGLKEFNGPDFEFISTGQDERSYEDVSNLVNEIQSREPETMRINQQVGQAIRDVLSQLEVEMKSDSIFDSSILGAQLADTGSSARRTNAPGNYDFDFAIRLDENDREKIPEIARLLREALQPASDQSHGDENSTQLRLGQCTGVSETSIDIDIALLPKWEAEIYASHDAISDKLDSIRTKYGEEAYYQALANIVLAKQILSQGQAYKKVEHGGFGGIGVENWILLNGGNLIRAFESFWEASHDETGQVLSLGEFARKYPIIDPGTNLRQPEHDNYSSRLTDNGYLAMVRTVGEYLGKAA